MDIHALRATRFMVAAAFSFGPSFVLAVERGRDVSYFCVVEFAGGLSFNQKTNKWEGTKFRTDDRFVLRLKFLQSRTEKSHFGEDQQVHDYKVTIIKSGTSSAVACGGDSVSVTNERVECTSTMTNYQFNLENNRFLGSYPHGYVDGIDNSEDTPRVSGGRCMKIDSQGVFASPMPRRFPPPWTLVERRAITDASGQALAQVYFEDNDSRRSVTNRLVRDEARRIAANVAKLPSFIETDRHRKAKGQ